MALTYSKLISIVQSVLKEDGYNIVIEKAVPLKTTKIQQKDGAAWLMLFTNSNWLILSWYNLHEISKKLKSGYKMVIKPERHTEDYFLDFIENK